MRFGKKEKIPFLILIGSIMFGKPQDTISILHELL